MVLQSGSLSLHCAVDERTIRATPPFANNYVYAGRQGRGSLPEPYFFPL